MSYGEKEIFQGNNDNSSLVADLIANNIYQYEDGTTSSALRFSFIALDKLLKKGLIKQADIELIKLGVLLANLIQETTDLDIGEELVSHVKEI